MADWPPSGVDQICRKREVAPICGVSELTSLVIKQALGSYVWIDNKKRPGKQTVEKHTTCQDVSALKLRSGINCARH